MALNGLEPHPSAAVLASCACSQPKTLFHWITSPCRRPSCFTRPSDRAVVSGRVQVVAFVASFQKYHSSQRPEPLIAFNRL